MVHKHHALEVSTWNPIVILPSWSQDSKNETVFQLSLSMRISC